MFVVELMNSPPAARPVTTLSGNALGRTSPASAGTENMKTKRYVLQSTVNGGFFMNGNNERDILSSCDFDNFSDFLSEIKKFDTRKEAEDFIDLMEYFALEVCDEDSVS